uniref:small monomeric GTPase n=1 Tax=Arion vulgaris TaxID=1028688 RepID=A0A0B6YQU0_9EUPU
MWCGPARGRQRLRSESDCSVYDEEYKIVLVGAKDVGKTAICQVYVGGKEQANSCDRLVIQKTAKLRRAEFCTWDTVDGHTCCMRLSELHMSPSVTPQIGCDDPIIKSLTQRADGFLLIYSVTDNDSFRATSNYYGLLMQLRSHIDTPLVFIAHKTDCITGQVVTSDEGRDAAFDIGASYYETSVRSDSEGIKFVFHDVIRQVRSVRSHARTQEHTCNKVRGLIHRLSLKSRKKRSKSRSQQKLTSADQVQGQR